MRHNRCNGLILPCGILVHMQILISKASGFIYRHVAKPVLFRLSPDSVHERMIRSASFAQRLPLLGRAISASWAHRDEAMLGQTVHGIRFTNPIGLSAGLDKNGQIVPMVRAIGFGFGTIGSVTARASSGNPRPWYHRLPHSRSLVVNAGLPNQGVERILHRVRAFPSGVFTSFPLVVSVAKTNEPATCTDQAGVSDYVASLRALQHEPRVSVLEINISCPNAFGGEPFTTPKRLEALLAATDKLRIKKPIWIKMPINLPWPDFKKLLDVIVAHPGVTGVTIGNLNKDRASTALTDPLPDTIPGNLSGKPTEALSNDLIFRTYASYGKQLTIIGVGGVFTADDAYEKIKRGASLVDLITGLIFGGPQVIGRINRDLARLLKKDGYGNVSEAVGCYHRDKKPNS